MTASFPSNDANSRPTAGKATGAGAYQALRRFVQQGPLARTPLEHCDLCGEMVMPEHRHLLDLNGRTVACACQACALLFSNEGAGGGKYRLIPERYLALSDFHMTDEQWDGLMIPVNMVYIFYSTPEKRVVAFYPSPAGPTESLLNLETWETLVERNAILNELSPDVEALLINRVRGENQYYIVPIDTCFQLVGLIRSSWRGLSGGEEAWKAITTFFTNLQQRAKFVPADTKEVW